MVAREVLATASALLATVALVAVVLSGDKSHPATPTATTLLATAPLSRLHLSTRPRSDVGWQQLREGDPALHPRTLPFSYPVSLSARPSKARLCLPLCIYMVIHLALAEAVGRLLRPSDRLTCSASPGVNCLNGGLCGNRTMDDVLQNADQVAYLHCLYSDSGGVVDLHYLYSDSGGVLALLV